ncbi:MAG: hypothetical protein M3485_08670 [Pseudomonadota bacterium]|nr:hypothetical protein [Pseudomonadota bacterium]
MRKRMALWICAVVVMLLLVVVGLRIALQPERTVPLLLEQLGEGLGLEITATGTPELALRGTPTLVVRGLSARQSGASKPVLQAERALLSLPWATIRDRGATLDLARIELDAPVIDLPALRRWLATRPPGETRFPTLRDGLQVHEGRIDGVGWRVEGLDASVPELHPDRPFNARVQGLYADGSTRMPFDLALALTRPASQAGIAVVGSLEVQRRDWQLPAQVRLSGPMRQADGSLHVAPARLEISAVHVSGDARRPFVLGLHGPLRYRAGTWTLAPAGMAMRAQPPLPDFDAHGAIALGRRLVLRLEGRLPQWLEGWPALPPPLGSSDSPLPFALDYAGPPSLAGIARLQLRRDGARFDARFRLPEVLEWIEDGGAGTPLPPLTGSASAPRLEISGAQLEGVEIIIEDPGVPAPERSR